MKNKLIRFRSVALIFVLLVPASVQALIPLLVGASYYFAADALFVNILGAATVVVGATLGWVTFGNPTGQPISNAPIRVQLNPLSPQPAPVGWTAATLAESAGGSTAPHPPLTKSATMAWAYRGGGSPSIGSLFPAGGFTSSELAAVAACNLDLGGSAPVFLDQFADASYQGTLSVRYTCVGIGGAQGSTIKVGEQPMCEAGYSYLSTVCNVYDEALVNKPVDGKCDIVAMVKDAKDPDCINATNVTADGTRVEVADTGNAFAGGRVIANNDGTVTIVSETRDVSTGTVTYEYVVAGDFDGNGNQPVQSKGAGVGRGPGYTGATGNGNGNGTGGTGTCGGAGQPACSTGGGAVCGKAPLPPCEIDFGGQSTQPGDPQAQTAAEIHGLLQLPGLATFKTFTLPGHISECPKPTFTAFEVVHTFDAHCALLDAQTAVLRAAMSLVFGISAIFIVLRA